MEKSWDYRSTNKTWNSDSKEDHHDGDEKSYDNIKETLKPSKILLSFNKGAEGVDIFYENLFTLNKKENYLMLGLVSLIIVYDFYCEVWKKNLSFFEIHSIIRLVFVFAFALIIKYFDELFQKRYLTKVLIIFYFSFNIILLWTQITHSKTITLIEIAQVLLLKFFYQNISIILFAESLYFCLFLLSFFLIFQITSMLQFLYLLFIMMVHLYSTRVNQVRNISKHNLNIANSIKKTQQKTLVRYLLPIHIHHQFIENPSAKLELIENFNDVTILFADIKGFTDFSAHHPAHVVVNMLRDLFTEFDKLCLQNDVYKLYTIGDCYVALGLIDANERNVEEEARNVIQFAFDMINAIKSVRKKNPELEMRIGIHIVIMIIF